jgi:hypothetical protein
MATSTIQRMDAATAVATVDGQRYARLQVDWMQLGRPVMLPCRSMMKPPEAAASAVAISWLSCAVVEAVNVVVMNTNLWEAFRPAYATCHAEVFSC